MHIASIGIDLGKTTFHLIALDERGKVVIKKKFSRKQLLAYSANLSPSLIGMEACSGAHFVGATLRDQGHEVKLIPAQFVKPFRKSNKNDAALTLQVPTFVVLAPGLTRTERHSLPALLKTQHRKPSVFLLDAAGALLQGLSAASAQN